MGDSFGARLRSWRLARRRSQEQLSVLAGVSTRHISFVETGRAQPSREFVLALTEALEVPLRDRNELLLIAGFAPAYRASPLDGDELAYLRRAIDHMLAQQEPYGAFIIDPHYELVGMNAGAQRLIQRLPPASADGRAAMGNLLMATVHPEALRPYVVNWDEVAGQLVARLHREISARPSDEGLARLLARVLAQPAVPAAWRVRAPGRTAAPFVTVHLRAPGFEVRLFTLLTSIGTPLDVTAEELHLETYFPVDAASDAALRGLLPG